jgi:hypothetical protein
LKHPAAAAAETKTNTTRKYYLHIQPVIIDGSSLCHIGLMIIVGGWF